jgi:ATP-dependent DNA helicase RecG
LTRRRRQKDVALALLASLCALPRETEWLEFKENYFDADEVAEYVSALANSAMLVNESHAYPVFGVNDRTHQIVGTSVHLKDKTVGAEPFENWLSRSLSPRLNLEIVECTYESRHVEILRIDPAHERPMAFRDKEFIRIGSVKKQLREYPARARALWAATSRFSFEQGVAIGHVTAEQIAHDFVCDEFFRLLNNSSSVSQQTAIDTCLRGNSFLTIGRAVLMSQISSLYWRLET